MSGNVNSGLRELDFARPFHLFDETFPEVRGDSDVLGLLQEIMRSDPVLKTGIPRLELRAKQDEHEASAARARQLRRLKRKSARRKDVRLAYVWGSTPDVTVQHASRLKSGSACKIGGSRLVHYELDAGDVAKVLHISYNKLDRLTRKGVIPLANTDWRNENEWRAYDPRAIAKYARSRNIVPDWDALKN